MRSPVRLLFLTTALAVSIPLAAPAQDVTEERGVNRRGSDYSTFDARDVRDCIRACERDSRCEAYAYNNMKSICYLKDRVPPAEQDGTVTSGVKRGVSSGGSWGGSGRFSEERGVAYRGEDYSKFLSRGQNACERECRRDDRCVGYTFNLRTDMCFLKDRLGRSERDGDTVSGVKRGGSGGRPGSGWGGDLSEEWNLAYRGEDYTDFRSTNLQDCKDACRRDRRCVGYTYNHRSDVCYLKDRLGRAERDDNAISGTKGGSGGRPGSGYDDLTQEWGVNRPGSDYRDFRADDVDDCQDACRRDRRCRAYAFNTRDRVCYLKDRVPGSERKSDVVSGVKDGY